MSWRRRVARRAKPVTDFRRLIETLSTAAVDYILVGGVAATVHGSVRLTADVDIVYARDRGNLARLVRALSQYEPYLRGAPPGLPFELSVDTLQSGLNFTLTTTAGALDLLGEITGGGNFEDLIAHTIEVQLFGYPCRCLDLPTLIRVKRAAGRPKDLESIAELEAILEERNRTR